MAQLRWLPAILALLSSSAAAQTAAPEPRTRPEPSALFAEIDSILDELSRITGMKKVKSVRTATMNREALKAFLEKRIDEVVDPKDVRAEEITLKRFGFLPKEFDLRKSTVELMTEQAAAFYDYREKKLYLVEGGAADFEKPALVHELAHALADQHFNLQKFVKPQRNDDSVLARMAVVEGQATWLMSEFLARKMGQSLKDSPLAVEMMSRAAENMSGQFPVLEKAPLYLRETLLFPYGRGMLFQQAAIGKLNKEAFSQVFRDPPVSTQQILHPDLYFNNTRPVSPALPEFAKQNGDRVLNEGSVGELDHSILLRHYISREDADRITPQLRGGSYKVLESKDGKRFVLLYTSEWKDSSVASEYFRLYQRVLKGKWQTFTTTEESPSRVSGSGDDGGFELRLEGLKVLSIEGIR
jgi:hypothetical protein